MFTEVNRVFIEELEKLVKVEELAWSSPGENIEASRKKISRRAEKKSGQIVILATINGEPAGSQYAFRFCWDGQIDKLSSWDEYAAEGWTEKVHKDSGETGFLVGVGVVPKFRGIKCSHNLSWPGEYKISELLIAKTLEELFSNPLVKRVIANARIPFYHLKPELSVEDYCSLRGENGKLFDPVLRFHERMGAKIIKPVTFSMEDAESLNAGCWVVYEHSFQG
jgi:hypothetical protein